MNEFPWNYHGRPQAWQEGATFHPLENVQSIKQSIKRPDALQLQHFANFRWHKKSLSQDTLHWFEIYLNCDCGQSSVSDPLGQLTALPQL